MKYLYICAEFDEHRLSSEIFLDIESLSNHVIGIKLNIDEILSNQDEDDVGLVKLLSLLERGYYESEWFSEELYVIDDNGLTTFGLPYL